MDVRKFILRQIITLAIGQVICVGLMIGVYALLRMVRLPVILGGVFGAVLSIGNYFFMAISADRAADKARDQDVKGGQAVMRSSFLLRMVVIFGLMFVLYKSGLADPIALVLPLAFPRIILTVAEFFRKGRVS